jgi:hypothetical protein
MTGLRARRLGSDNALRLLPTDLFTVLVDDLQQLQSVSAGHVLAKVVRIGRPQSVRDTVNVQLGTTHSLQTVRMCTELSVELAVTVATVKEPKKARLLLRDDYVLLATLLKANDELVIMDPIFVDSKASDNILTYTYDPSTTILQCPADPLPSPATSQSAATIDNRHRTDRLYMHDLVSAYSRNSTTLVQVRHVNPLNKVGNDAFVALEVCDSSEDGAVPYLVYCWHANRSKAASLLPGQLVVLSGIVTKPTSSKANSVRIDIADSEGGLVIPVPMRGYVWNCSFDLANF